MEEKEKLLENMMKEREREKCQLEEVKGGGATQCFVTMRTSLTALVCSSGVLPTCHST